MPIVLQVQVEGDVDWGTVVERHLKTRFTEIRRGVGREGLALLRAAIPAKTGKTRDAAYFRTRATPEGFEVDLGVARRRHDIFQMLVHGTPRHDITGDPLVFFWERGPEGPGTYFFTRVDHPGFKSRVNVRALEREVERAGLREAFLFMLRFEQGA